MLNFWVSGYNNIIIMIVHASFVLVFYFALRVPYHPTWMQIESVRLAEKIIVTSLLICYERKTLLYLPSRTKFQCRYSMVMFILSFPHFRHYSTTFTPCQSLGVLLVKVKLALCAPSVTNKGWRQCVDIAASRKSWQPTG